ncbi:YopX family protein [Intestinibacter bartlettii]|jgi:uncharacterized phage protein (TIGR01671 family)|uniref:YopX family protein n=1 Tax=Intestinibacter bartlettii TaxID=261299 RepID=UPI003992C233
MREMKVRGYSLDEGQWIKGFGAEYNDDLETYLVHNYRGFFEVDGESIGEYTGEEDVNGKEIYEGDIIRLEGVDDREIGSTWEHIGKIVYKRGAFFVCYFDYYADGDEELICDAQVEFGTVIGNIYENKNLLEED